MPLYANDPEGVRAEFLTLPAFLTLSSRADRTSPTSRAKTILGAALLRAHGAARQRGYPGARAPRAGRRAPSTNVRKELEKHRASPDCAGCHDVLDPIGLSLENFDPIGAYRTQYPNGDAIDATGVYEGAAFEDISGLVPALAEGRPVGDLPSEQLFSYALRRRPSARRQDQDQGDRRALGRRDDRGSGEAGGDQRGVPPCESKDGAQ